VRGRFADSIEALALEISGKTSGAASDPTAERRGWRIWRRAT
jgi:hypothetical protein